MSVSSLGPAERSGPSEDDRILVGPLSLFDGRISERTAPPPPLDARDATQAGLLRRGDLREAACHGYAADTAPDGADRGAGRRLSSALATNVHRVG